MKSLTKLILIAVIGLLAVAGIILYLIRPSLAQVVKYNAELKEKRIETKTLEEQIIAFKTAQSDLAKAVEKDRITNAIVVKEDLVRPVQNLEAAAIATNSEESLRIEDDEAKLAPGEVAKPRKPITGTFPGIKEIPFEASIVNDFDGIVNFLRYLENSPYLTGVTRLEMAGEKTAGSATSGQIISNFKGVFYVVTQTAPPVEQAN